MSKSYIVLEDDTLDELAEKAHISKESLQELLDKSKMFGWAEVFWETFGAWYSMRVASEYIAMGNLDLVMEMARRWQHA